MSMRICGEILPGHPVTQTFLAADNYLSGIAVLIATYDEKKRTSSINISLRCITDTVRYIASREIKLSQVYDNSFVEVFFEPELSSAGSLYEICVCSDDSSHNNAATLYITDGDQRIKGHVACDSFAKLSDEDGIIAKLSYAPSIVSSRVPPNLEISLVTQCNLNCVHCISRETRKVARRMGPIIRDAVRSWARSGALQTAYTDFSGDIFWADARFGGELDFLISLDIPFHVDTNGTHLSLDAINKVLASKVTSINISIDAANPETYKRIRKGSPHLDTIFGNMKMLSERRYVLGRHDVPLSAAFVAMRSNIEELPEFIMKVKSAGFDAVRTIHMQAYTSDMDHESLWHDQELFNNVRESAIEVANTIGIDIFIDRPFDDRDDQIGTSFCTLPWRAAYLLGNGDVLACCVPGLRMGNLNEQSMEEIWNGQKYQALRRAVNSDNRPASCRACPFVRKTNNPLSYMPHRVIRGLDFEEA